MKRGLAGRRARLALALGSSCLLALVACGSSSKGSKTANASSAPASSASRGDSSANNADPAAGFTKDSITIEGDVDKTSAGGQGQEGADIGAKARFNRANQEGGVNGRTIKYLGSLDNKYDPAQDLPVIRQIVQLDKAFAVVPMVEPVLAQGGTYLVQNNVPFFGWGVTPAFCNNNVGFGFSGCLVPTTATNKVSTASAGLMDKVLGQKDGTGKTVALISEDSVAGQFGNKVVEAAFVADKWTVTYAKAAIPSSAPVTDFTPYSQAILTSNHGKAPDVVFHVTSTANVEGLSKALTNAGYKGLQENALTYDPAFLSSSSSRDALQNAYVFIQFGSFESNAPVVSQMLKDVKAVDPSQQALTQDIATGYYSADLFLHYLQKAGHTLSRQALLDAANDGSSYEITGGLGKLSFPANHQNSVACGSLVQVQGQKYVEKVPLSCYSNVPLSVLGGG
jgi:hypothetical protein